MLRVKKTILGNLGPLILYTTLKIPTHKEVFFIFITPDPESIFYDRLSVT